MSYNYSLDCVVLYMSENVNLDAFFIFSGHALPETSEGAAWERQTHLCQHVPEICREGLEGNYLFRTITTRGHN